MKLDLIISLVCRLLFLVAGFCLALGVFEKIANLNGKTFTQSYTPERLLEITVAMAVLVVALLLRQIKERLPQP